MGHQDAYRRRQAHRRVHDEPVFYLALSSVRVPGLRPGGATKEEDRVSRATHFEICAEDPQRVVTFYQQAFGWKINKWEGPMEHWLIQTGEEDEPGIDGAIMGRENNWTTVNMISVPSLDEWAKRAEKLGGQIVSPRQAIPRGWLPLPLPRYQGKRLRYPRGGFVRGIEWPRHTPWHFSLSTEAPANGAAPRVL